MAWITVDVALALLGLAVLALLGFWLWRRVQVLGCEVRAASQRLGVAAAALDGAAAQPGSGRSAAGAGRPA
ncbi:MAG: hypothetical protein ACR2JO_02415 [Mycobacteriales bacterium]